MGDKGRGLDLYGTELVLSDDGRSLLFKKDHPWRTWACLPYKEMRASKRDLKEFLLSEMGDGGRVRGVQYPLTILTGNESNYEVWDNWFRKGRKMLASISMPMEGEFSNSITFYGNDGGKAGRFFDYLKTKYSQPGK